MEEMIKIGLPLYFILYFGVAFVGTTLLVAYRTSINPLVLPKDDSAYGLIGRYFKVTLMGLFVYTIMYAFVDISVFELLDVMALKYIGGLSLVLSLVWTVVAQIQMSDSWRIGIDHEHQTALKTTGVFGMSRNPIFLGMLWSLLGLFLVTPNGFTLLFLLLGYVLIQLQVRLEEDFLMQQHGAVYLEYKEAVRRFL